MNQITTMVGSVTQCQTFCSVKTKDKKKDVPFIRGDWNAKVGSQEIPEVTGRFGLGIQNKASQRLTEFCQENTLLRVSWTARIFNQFILKEFSPEYTLEGLMLKLKLQYFGYLMQRTDSTRKDPDARKD